LKMIGPAGVGRAGRRKDERAAGWWQDERQGWRTDHGKPPTGRRLEGESSRSEWVSAPACIEMSRSVDGRAGRPAEGGRDKHVREGTSRPAGGGNERRRASGAGGKMSGRRMDEWAGRRRAERADWRRDERAGRAGRRRGGSEGGRAAGRRRNDQAGRKGDERAGWRG
jgi:hypothetical protein